MNTSAAIFSNKGCVRNNNEDNFFLNGVYMEKTEMDAGSYACCESDAECQLYAVCDGMGGEANGEEASYIAVSSLTPFMEKLIAADDTAMIDLLDEYTASVNEQILAYGKRGHMGTTLAMLLIRDDYAYVAHMGDSRVYRIRDQKMERCTSDHTEANRLLSIGMITEEQYKDHPMKNAIVRYLGMHYPDMQITAEWNDLNQLMAGDRFLLCSDGLTDLVCEDKILTEIRGLSAKDAAQKLVNCALEAGGRDNVTVLIVDAAAEAWRHRIHHAIISKFSGRKTPAKAD